MDSKKLIFVGIVGFGLLALVYGMVVNTQVEDPNIANRDITATDPTDETTDNMTDETQDGSMADATDSTSNMTEDMSEVVADPANGEALYQQQTCFACHSVDGTQGLGPSFAGLWMAERTFADGTTRTADADYIHQSIRDPNSQVVEGFNPAMAPYSESQLSDADINDIIAYIQTLSQ